VMKSLNDFSNWYFNEISMHAKKLDLVNFELFLCSLARCRDLNSTVYFVGNGGSSAIVAHCAVDYENVLGITVNTMESVSLHTCYSNDYGYQHGHERWLSKRLRPNDLLVCVSSSGQSKNVLNALEVASKVGCKSVAFTGFDSKNGANSLADQFFWVDSTVYNIIENVHQIWLLLACDHLKNHGRPNA